MNENTHDHLQFFGVQLEVVQIEDSLKAPKFNIIVNPNNWVRPLIISDDYWRNFIDYLEHRGSSLEVLRWHGGSGYLGFYLGYGDNNGQHPDYWISAGKNSGFIAANFCLNKQNLPNIRRWFANNQQDIDRKFDEEFDEKPQRPPNPYIEVGISRQSSGEIEHNLEFKWLRERLEKLERLFKHGGEINFSSDEDL